MTRAIGPPLARWVARVAVFRRDESDAYRRPATVASAQVPVDKNHNAVIRLDFLLMSLWETCGRLWMNSLPERQFLWIEEIHDDLA